MSNSFLETAYSALVLRICQRGGGLSLDLGVVQAADGELVVHAPEQRPAAVLRGVVQNNFRKCGKATQKDDSRRIVLTSSM